MVSDRISLMDIPVVSDLFFSNVSFKEFKKLHGDQFLSTFRNLIPGNHFFLEEEGVSLLTLHIFLMGQRYGAISFLH